MSRTTKTLKNSEVAMIFYVIELALNFFNRRIFIDYVGVDLLGLNTTSMNLLQFLNLAELGISQAVAFSLFKPLAENDRTSLREIIHVQGWLYRRIAYIVMAGSAVMMCAFPWIFKKIELPLWYAYASFGVLLYTALLTYFVNYRQVIFTASQQDYKVVLNYKSVILLKIAAQILAMRYLANGYEWWLALQVVFATLASWNLHRAVLKEFPYLKEISGDIGSLLKEKYRVIILKVKQLFFHRVAGYVLSQTSPLIIYAYTTLAMVAWYGNYMLIVQGLEALFRALFNSVAAGVGDLVASQPKERVAAVFDEVFTSRFLIVSTVCFTTWRLIDPMIIIWIGEESVLSSSVKALIVFILYVQLMRTIVDNFIFAYALYQDIWAPMAEAAINISLSVTLGYFFGIPGILGGVAISLFAIVVVWKPFFLFRSGIGMSVIPYVKMYGIHLVVFAVTIFAANALLSHISIKPDDLFNWIICSLITASLFFFLEWLLLLAVTKEMRMFTLRMVSVISRKKK